MTEQPRIRVFCVDDHPLLRENGDIAEKALHYRRDRKVHVEHIHREAWSK
jgi:hypothetical protein